MADNGNKKVVVAGICAVLLVAMVVALTVGVKKDPSGGDDNSDNSQQGGGITTTAKAIQNICQPTDYKQACQDSLASANSTDMKDLIRLAFHSAKKRILEASSNSTVLHDLEEDPRAKEALDNCRTLAETAADDIERSFNQMGELDFTQVDHIVDNLKTWLSAAMTYQETCLDGFENTTSDAGEKMKQYLKLSMELTNNGLAIVTEISNAFSSMEVDQSSPQRRLFSKDDQKHTGGRDDEFPYWVQPGTRRLMRQKGRLIKTNLVVAQDGSGNFTTITEALLSIPRHLKKTFVLHIKEGVYTEKIQVDRNLTYLMMFGDGPNKTRITGRDNFIDGTTTFHTATVAVLGSNFIAKDIGFENSAGAEKHQAVALRVGSDLSIFYGCHMDGYQDTLYAHTYRQFYRDCTISGTIDFIFGDSASLFQNCTMLVRRPMDNQANIVTAQGRKLARQPTAIVLQKCHFVADPAYYPVRNTILTYLARPWKEYSRTIIMESYLDDLITSDGFMPWDGPFGLDTCYYAEYNNRGPGSSTAKRVKWKGIKQVNRTTVRQFTANRFLGGDRWVRPRRVPKSAYSAEPKYIPYSSGFIYPTPEEEKDEQSGKTVSVNPAPIAGFVYSPTDEDAQEDDATTMVAAAAPNSTLNVSPSGPTPPSQDASSQTPSASQASGSSQNQSSGPSSEPGAGGNSVPSST